MIHIQKPYYKNARDKRMRKGIQLCYPFDESRLLKWNPPYIVQPKLDGDRCRALIDDNGVVTLLSSEENIITSVPHINHAIEKLGLHSVELDGELYTHGMNHQQIHGIASRTVNLHNRMEDLEYHIFDIVNDMQQWERTNFLFNNIYPLLKGNLQHVQVRFANNLEDVMFIYDEFIAAGYEGIIVREFNSPYVRKRSNMVMKFKPKKDDYYTVVGYVEEISIEGIPKNSLGALVCSSGEETFNVGSGFTRDQRNDLWKVKENLIGKVVRVAYQHLTSGKNIPRFPVFSEIIWDIGE